MREGSLKDRKRLTDLSRYGRESLKTATKGHISAISLSLYAELKVSD
jgi:hypothetical protein